MGERVRERERIRFDVNDAVMHCVNPLRDKPLWWAYIFTYEMKSQIWRRRHCDNEVVGKKYTNWEDWELLAERRDYTIIPFKFTDLPMAFSMRLPLQMHV